MSLVPSLPGALILAIKFCDFGHVTSLDDVTLILNYITRLDRNLNRPLTKKTFRAVSPEKVVGKKFYWDVNGINEQKAAFKAL